MPRYDAGAIETKWQAAWVKQKSFTEEELVGQLEQQQSGLTSYFVPKRKSALGEGESPVDTVEHKRSTEDFR